MTKSVMANIKLHILCFASLFILYNILSVQAIPNFSQEYPHLVTLNINNYMLYSLSTKSTDPLNSDSVATILETLLSKHHVTIDRINVQPALKTLKEKKSNGCSEI